MCPSSGLPVADDPAVDSLEHIVGDFDDYMVFREAITGKVLLQFRWPCADLVLAVLALR